MYLFIFTFLHIRKDRLFYKNPGYTAMKKQIQEHKISEYKFTLWTNLKTNFRIFIKIKTTKTTNIITI